MKTTLIKTMAITLLALFLGGTSRAGFVVDVTESGGNVVAVGSGTIDTTDLTYLGLGNAGAEFNGALEVALFGPNSPVIVTYYNGMNTPTAFGTINANVGADIGNGDLVGVTGSRLWLPQDYVSGAVLNSTSTWSGQTFASLGLTPGTYTWTWGSGTHADYFTMNIGTAAVPEPSSVVMLGLGSIGLIGVAMRSRRKSAV